MRSGDFDLLDDATVTFISLRLTGKDATRFAATSKRMNVLETRSPRELRHSDLITFFTTSLAATADARVATVAWLNDTQERLTTEDTIDVYGAPFPVFWKKRALTVFRQMTDGLNIDLLGSIARTLATLCNVQQH